jgi:hypothetical protein
MGWLIGLGVIAVVAIVGALFYAGAIQTAHIEATAHLRPGGRDRRPDDAVAECEDRP